MTPVQIDDGNGLIVDLLDYGARITQINYNNRNLALTYSQLDDYLSDPYYLGATIGPITNRIQSGQLTISGQQFQMPKNEGDNSLHSGNQGLDKQVWGLQKIGKDFAEFQLDYDLTKAGLKGLLEITAHYSVEAGSLRVVYETHADHDTYVNLTNHVYLNLTGERSRISDHEFTLLANSMVNVDEHSIPNGKITEFTQPLSYNIDAFDDINELKGSADHHFNVAGEDSHELRTMLNAHSNTTGITLEVRGNSAGFQFYTGQYLSAPFTESSGFCVETQYAPDAINQHNLYAPVLKSGQSLTQITEYSFDQIG